MVGWLREWGFRGVRSLRSRFCFGLLGIALAAFAAAEDDSLLARLQGMHLDESPGAVPVLYVAAAKDRALGYQDLEQAAHAWYEEQLLLRAPLTLAVLDRGHYQDPRVALGWPMPYSITQGQSVIVFPTHIEDLAPDGPSTKMPGEHILYHETGHIVAHAMGIASGNNFANEIVADVFLAAYVHAKRPELAWALAGPPSDFKKPLRYMSLADLDYLDTGVGFENYLWFQANLRHAGDFLVHGEDFAGVAAKLRQAFPASAKKQESVNEIVARLDGMRPGFREMLGPLAGPSTLPLIQPSACREGSDSGRRSGVAIYNKTNAPLTVTLPKGDSQTLPPQSWSSFPVNAGASIGLSDGSCVVAIDEPALAIVE